MDEILETFFLEAQELLADFEADLLRLEETPGDAELLNRIFRTAHTIKGNAGMCGFDAIAHFTHALEDLLDQLRKGVRVIDADIAEALLIAGDTVRTMMGRAERGVEASAADQAAITSARAHLQRILDGAPAPAATPPAAPTTAPVPAADVKADHDDPPSGKPAAQDNATIRVPIAKVDRLINLVGELVITQSIVAQALAETERQNDSSLLDALGQLERHARALHEHVLAIRMIPVRTLFGRFPRLVRDLAGSIGKQVALEVMGEDTELDKTVIEKIGDPLTHLVRNAVDHGIEPSALRGALGKSEVGRIRLEAYQRGGSIYIEVEDDGKGLDRHRLVDKAIERGLIPAEAVLSDEEAFALVFRAGISTAETITEVSGRGVGMDVVKRNVEALGGTIAIDSAPGRGTRFCIKLPLTLAIMDGQTLRAGGQPYILPLIAITESVRPQASSVHAIAGGGEVILVREQTLPLLRLHRLLGVPSALRDPTEGLVVIVEHEHQRLAILVDELLGQQQIVVKSLDAHFRRVEGLAGATILGDGRVALILDVAGLMTLASKHALPAAA